MKTATRLRPQKLYRVTCPFCPESKPTWSQGMASSKSEAERHVWEMTHNHIASKHPAELRAFILLRNMAPVEFVPTTDGYQPKEVNR